MELFVLLATLAVVGLVFLVLLKALFWIVFLPVKLAFWAVKGILALILFVPAVVLCVSLLSVALPFVVMILLGPVILIVLALGALAKAVF